MGYTSVMVFENGGLAKQAKSSILFAVSSPVSCLTNRTYRVVAASGAYGISLELLADIEDSPKAFVVYNGKLYICGNEAALEEVHGWHRREYRKGRQAVATHQ